MSAICLFAGAASLRFAAGLVTLAWTHSIEKVEWRETWAATPAGIVLTEARIKGSGAGMEPGDGARLERGWWVWTPNRPASAELHLARSGATGDWRICAEGSCATIEALFGRPMDGGEARLAPCD